jgi:hypothetical protein
MIRFPRLPLYTLLILMQMLAPWVHAHMGQETGGSWHLPGLEGLVAGGDKAFEAANGAAGFPDLIVAMPVGVTDAGQNAKLPPASLDQPPAMPMAAFSPAPFPQFAGGLIPTEIPPSPSCPNHPRSAPRAPPLSYSPI